MRERVKYGKFAYYTGGDLPSGTNFGKDPWRDVETPAAEACGPVSVAVLNHYGYFDADGPGYVRALLSAGVRDHGVGLGAPDSEYAGGAVQHDDLSGTARCVCDGAEARAEDYEQEDGELQELNGHVVVRVEEGGENFRIAVVSNADESGRVVGSFGPYAVRRLVFFRGAGRGCGGDAGWRRGWRGRRIR